MHKAKAFFLVCAGIFLLALSYHVGARSAGAQSTGTLECASVGLTTGSYPYSSAVINRQLYRICPACGAVAPSASIPGTARAVACGWDMVVLEDGSVYVYDAGSWKLQGTFSVGTGSVSVAQQSWGQVKATYAR